MDDLSTLLQQFSFHERWRGYDPDEVDAYVEKVIKAAEAAQAQIETLQQQLASGVGYQEQVPLRDTAGAQRTTPDPSLPSVSATQAAQGIARTLEMAQQVADDAVADAHQRAEQMIAEATSQATETVQQAQTTLADAQAEAEDTRRAADEYSERTIADAETQAKEREEALAATEREKHAIEIAALSAQRVLLSEDVDILNEHLAQQRQTIEASLSKITELVTSPETFRQADTPALSAQPDLSAETEAASIDPSDADPSDADPSDAGLSDAALGDAGLSDAMKVGRDAAAEAHEEADHIAEGDIIGKPATSEGGDLRDSRDLEEGDLHDPDDFEEVADASAVGGVVAQDPREPVDEAITERADVLNDVPGALFSEEPGVSLRVEDEIGEIVGKSEKSTSPTEPDSTQSRFVTVADLEEQGSLDHRTSPKNLHRGEAARSTAPSDAANQVEEEPILAQLRETASKDNLTSEDDEAASAFFNQDEEQKSRSWFLGKR